MQHGLQLKTITHRFQTAEQRHSHSRLLLDELEQHEEFMSSIDTVVDLKTDTGLDILWWATRTDENVPRNYNCIGVDSSSEVVHAKNKTASYKNVKILNSITDIEQGVVDVLFAKNDLAYSLNPLNTLSQYHQVMSDGGMLVICLPYTVNNIYNEFKGTSDSGCYFHYMPGNIMLMMAVSGFDCSDSRLYVYPGDQYFWIVGYKVDQTITTNNNLYEIAESGLIPQEATNFINRFGYLNDDCLIGKWFNGSNYLFKR